MARVLFAVEAIVLVFLLPLVPGIPPSLYFVGAVQLGLVTLLPLLAAVAIWPAGSVLRALRDSFGHRRLGPGSEASVRIWKGIVDVFPVTGGASLLLIGVLVGDSWGLRPGLLPVALVLAWVALGFTLYSVLQEVVAKLASVTPSPDQRSLPGSYAVQYQLTQREAEVAELLLRGLSYREIAERLFISPATAKTHALHVYQKTGASSKHELGRFTAEHVD